MERNPYLIYKAMKKFLIASILTMAVAQVNTTIDGVIVSHLVGPSALSAVNLYAPIALVVSSFSNLLGISSTIIAAKALGERDKLRVENLLSTGLASVLVFGILLAVGVWFFEDAISGLICKEECLRPYFNSYMMVMVTFAVVTMTQMLVNQSVAIDGHPELVTKMVSLTAILNLVLDLLFVGVFNLGIAGSAYATVLSMFVNILLVSTHFHGNRCSFKINPFKWFSFKSLGENVQQGIPLIISNVVLALMFVLLNNVIQYKQGADGMFAMSICMNLLALGMMFQGGLSSMTMSVGGFMFGQEDYIGVRILVNKTLKLLLVILCALVAVIEIFPGLFSMIFGADTPRLIVYVNRSLRIFAPLLPTILLALTLANIYQMVGRLVLTPIIVMFFPIILIPSLYGTASICGNVNIWYAFPFAGILVLIIAVVLSEIVKMKNSHLAHITLIPIIVGVEKKEFNDSVQANWESVCSGLKNINSYLHQIDVDEDMANKMCLCLEELLLNIVQHAGRNIKDHYIDLHVHKVNDHWLASIKDDGSPFDPVHFDEDRRGAGLKLVHSFCDDIDYQYMYGQNMTFLKWNNIKNK